MSKDPCMKDTVYVSPHCIFFSLFTDVSQCSSGHPKNIYLNCRALDVMLCLHVLNKSIHCHYWLSELVIYFSSCHRAEMIWDTRWIQRGWHYCGTYVFSLQGWQVSNYEGNPSDKWD